MVKESRSDSLHLTKSGLGITFRCCYFFRIPLFLGHNGSRKRNSTYHIVYTFCAQRNHARCCCCLATFTPPLTPLSLHARIFLPRARLKIPDADLLPMLTRFFACALQNPTEVATMDRGSAATPMGPEVSPCRPNPDGDGAQPSALYTPAARRSSTTPAPRGRTSSPGGSLSRCEGGTA